MPVPNSHGHVRQSYIEKDRVVRNSTAAPMPGVDCMVDFQLSKKEFENVFLQAQDRVDHSPDAGSSSGSSTTVERARPRRARKDRAPRPTPLGDRALTRGGRDARLPADRPIGSQEDAARHADSCRRMAARLQRAAPPDFDGAGELFEKAIDARARFGLHCCAANADAHVEYAQNLSKRGLTPEAEYHLRTAADVFRILDARGARKYGDVLLYIAVVVDRQGRLAEAENFYRSALGVYRANKLSDDNVRVAIDSLSNNLRAQGRGEEVDTVIQRHFLGAPERV